MNQSKRQTLQMMSVFSLAIVTGLIKTTDVIAVDWQSKLFEMKNTDDILKALGGNFKQSTDLVITAPEIAENGAVVPVSVNSNVGKTTTIAILVEKNPNPLSAKIKIPEGTEPAVTTRVKMAGTSKIYAIAEVDGKWIMNSKEIKVTLGGCGG